MDKECHSIVIEYLVHNCFKNTAKALLRERQKLQLCGKTILSKVDLKRLPTKDVMEDESQWQLLDARKSLIHAVQSGNIELAFDLIHRYFPLLTQDSVHAVFKLKCQQFIEIIRFSSELEAIQYAQLHLKTTHPYHKELVKEVTALIAYADPHISQSRYLLTQEKREQIASELNDALLVYCNLPIQTSMERLTRQYSVITEELEKTTSNCSFREKLAI
ncbi:CTLH/CRA C-terminal to lish motif domain-containing protein [Gilbertella persicaria]|uniref:CTLH/CRA C-terminal to lish motif domain-containing protein n=1 Tax=Gilbertella persicaria TaxID=101096 RepID=UPI00221E6FF3|nr:CTLH/CRA C-terminal to lish motif domain-containing protein [Gilbertella persicaria]KAI8069864.1 CTLH/CRA C-terminal to lish motif domain-containing protein [Gilbertella persicaria]